MVLYWKFAKVLRLDNQKMTSVRILECSWLYEILKDCYTWLNIWWSGNILSCKYVKKVLGWSAQWQLSKQNGFQSSVRAGNGVVNTFISCFNVSIFYMYHCRKGDNCTPVATFHQTMRFSCEYCFSHISVVVKIF